ncbi:unnamed protein product [Prorocentrum cordatum]|uniref:Uncharacterized protein n=1 Tax=Prorocentrum cordatum TaxID=2364126 RepID=A0ABN9YKB3_9DINO|nr:unnamed protein product [Polarella glacialis]
MSIKMRYVPPSAAEPQDVAVDLSLTLNYDGTVGFLGNRPLPREWIRWSTIRTYMISFMADSLHGLRAVISHAPVQIYFHRVMDPLSPLESFRISQLATNGACVVSQRWHPKDEAMFEGVVHFADSENLESVYKNISRDVRGCQARTRELYQKGFGASVLLEKSGFMRDWRATGHGGFPG